MFYERNFVRISFWLFFFSCGFDNCRNYSAKPPVSVIIKAPEGSEFTNSATYDPSNSEYLNNFNDSSSGITSPTTRRSLNPDSSIESISKLNPKLHSLNFSSILKINQNMQDGPLQPKISNENTDRSIKISVSYTHLRAHET